MFGVSDRLNSNLIAVIDYITTGENAGERCLISSGCDINQTPAICGQVFQAAQIASLSGSYN